MVGQQFCTACGAALNEGMRFCENCGAPVNPGQPDAPLQIPDMPVLTTAVPSPASPNNKKILAVIAAGIIVLLIIILAIAALVLLPGMQDGNLPALPGHATAVPTTVPTPEPVITTMVTTTVPTPIPDPFPDAYRIKERFSFNEGKYASRATVYRYWMNETYQWHNDLDNKYWEERPAAGNKFLLVFVNIENIGSDGYPYPKSNMIVVHNGGNIYRVDTSHYIPNKAGDKDAKAIEILEMEQQFDYFNQERVEDYGYSHGTTQDFIYPGEGNAVDGYLIYQVPASLAPEDTWVEIVFDGQDRAVWRLTT